MAPTRMRRVPVAMASAHAWCFRCRGLRPFRWLPPLQAHRVPLTVQGQRVGEQVITFREGPCAACGASIWRVGGGRSAEPEEANEHPAPDPPEDLLFTVEEEPR